MKVKFWGCRGSIPVPDNRMIKYGGNTTCVEVKFGDKVLIIDAGTGIRKLGEDLIRRKILNFDIFITHTHWDHIQGFPFFAPIYGKETNINILGCSNSYRRLKDIFANQMSYEHFPVRFSDLESRINFKEICGETYETEKYAVKFIRTNHPIPTLGLRIEENGKSFVFITDNELNSEKVTTPRDKFIEFCRNATLLCHDAQFTENEYKKRKGWGHSVFEDVMELARDSEAENLLFFHHDPDRKDDELDKIEKKFKNLRKANGYKFKVSVVRETGEFELKSNGGR
ncbi:MAG: MBL fold metallo-hydrolase [bacterium]